MSKGFTHHELNKKAKAIFRDMQRQLPDGGDVTQYLYKGWKLLINDGNVFLIVDYDVLQREGPQVCAFCDTQNIIVVACLKGEPDKKVCTQCHAHPGISTEAFRLKRFAQERLSEQIKTEAFNKLKPSKHAAKETEEATV
jgi:hypothetical protein